MQSERGFEYGVKHILCPKSGQMIPLLSQVLELSECKIRELLALGSVYVMQKRATENLFLEAGQHVRIHTKPRRFPLLDAKWSERILFQNSDFLVFNKPSGHPCHPTVDNIQENLITDLSAKMGQPLFLTHRLDVPTSGLILFAKNLKYQSHFNELLKHDLVIKKYRAIVEGQCLHKGLLQHWMEPSPRAPKKVSENPHSGWSECQLIIEETQFDKEKNQTHLKIQLLTGRTHQIRCQLAAIGNPVRDDHMYGAQKMTKKDEIALSAIELHFEDFNFVLEN